MSGRSAEPSHAEMEGLFVNNEKLSRIFGYLNKFNPIRTMKMEGMEIRHSAILAWLLDPRETHGLGDRFLKAFVAEALRDHSGLGAPTALEVVQKDLRDAEIRREWRGIDIFISFPTLNWAFVVENKFYSRQRKGQLAEYIGKVGAYFDSQGKVPIVRGIFLTLFEEEPEDTGFAPIRYASICEILQSFLTNEASITEEVAMFLRHYLDVIEDETGMSEERNEMERLARDLYRNHKKVLDFVFEHGASTDFVIAAESLFGEDLEGGDVVSVGRNEYMYWYHNNYQYSFLPGKWYEAFGEDAYYWHGCEKWWAGYPLICWFQLFEDRDGTKGQVRLVAELGPVAGLEFRNSLIAEIKAIAQQRNLKDIRFQDGATKEGRKYSKFFKSNSADVSDIHDADKIAKAMTDLLKHFQPYFDAVAEVLPAFITYGKDEPLG